MAFEKSKCIASKDYIVILLVVGAIGLGVLSILRERIVDVDRERVSVTSEGKIFAKPDVANVSFGVNTDTQKEAKDAVKMGTEKMNAIMKALKSFGVEEKNIKTTGYNLRAVYEYPRDSGKRILSGYELDQRINLRIHDLDKMGEIIKEATNAGATQTGGITFTIDDPEELKAQARKEAIKRAKIKAEEIQAESGIELGKLVNVSEYGGAVPEFRNEFGYGGSSIMTKEAMDTIPDIESGEMEIKVNVTLTYKVK